MKAWQSLKNKILLILLSILLLAGCRDLSTKSEVAESDITDILDKLKISFRNDEISDFMDCFFSDYLHNGDTTENLEIVWSSRMINYNELEFNDVEVDIQDEYAVAYFTMKLTAENSSITFDEPYDEGLLSFFHKSGGVWKLHGNREDIGRNDE